jgi:hypothetical protein
MRLDEQIGKNFTARWGGCSWKNFNAAAEAEDFARRESGKDYTGDGVVVEVYDDHFNFLGYGPSYSGGRQIRPPQLQDELWQALKKSGN